jgi:hypothetical protein
MVLRSTYNIEREEYILRIHTTKDLQKEICFFIRRTYIYNIYKFNTSLIRSYTHVGTIFVFLFIVIITTRWWCQQIKYTIMSLRRTHVYLLKLAIHFVFICFWFFRRIHLWRTHKSICYGI